MINFVIGCWLLVVGYWLFVVPKIRQLVIGHWSLVIFLNNPPTTWDNEVMVDRIEVR